MKFIMSMAFLSLRHKYGNYYKKWIDMNTNQQYNMKQTLRSLKSV